MGMTSRHHRNRTTALVVCLLATAICATGLGAVAFASGESAKLRASALTGRIHLERRNVASGGTVRGELVFENHTSKTKVLLRGCKIDGLYAIGFRDSHGRVQAPAFPLVGCIRTQEMVAKPGTTIYRFSTLASYSECSQSPRQSAPKSSKYWIPLCLKDSTGERDIMPPLPVGQYAVLFFSDGDWHGPHIKPAVLIVTKKK